MKRRLLNKQNKNKHNPILEPIKNVYKTKNEQYNNNNNEYVNGENTICHFEISSIQDWKFGIMLREKNKLLFFAEHKDLSKKFNPEDAYVSEEIEGGNDVIRRIIPLLKDLNLNSEKHFSLSYEIGKLPEIMKPREVFERCSDVLREEFLEEVSISGVTVNKPKQTGLKNGDSVMVGSRRFTVHIEDEKITFK
ncbi:hypothetical protein F6Y05_34825 [Bacillus megaterium]|nr:hypothetical protein [Priestia megaterium]